MDITLIAAIPQDSDFCIGREGGIPWRLPEDMEHFKVETTGHPVIMGRRTFQSLPKKFRPLPDRANVVLTRDAEVLNAMHVGERFGKDCYTSASLDDALLCAEESGYPGPIYVIGGGDVYRQAQTRANRMVITWVDQRVEDGDTFWNPFEKDLGWRLVSSRAAVTFPGFFAWYERSV